ncbi:MAG: hypothetical protein Q9160_002358 [Pyrenula sp. 1 TL-2023]
MSTSIGALGTQIDRLAMDQPPSAGGQQQNRQPQQPIYDIRNGGHYGASAALAAQGYAPVPDLYSGVWANVNQGLTGQAKEILTTYWQQTINALETENHDYKIHQLPLARIKKVMKADPEVKMISAEAPILFAKGCDIFITELTMRAWIHAEDNKRRTLQRSDIAAALTKSDMFDFLIDIVPREEAATHAKRPPTTGGAPGSAGGPPSAGGAPPPPQQAPQPGQQPQPQQPQPPMGQPGDYGNPMGQHPMAAAAAAGHEQDYRQPPPMYGGHVPQSDPMSAYGQPQPPMFDNAYGGYPHMAPQQMYHQVNPAAAPLPPPNPASTSVSGPPHPAAASQQYQPGRQMGAPPGDPNDADAEGDRDYEVG